jgi:hypothetical protein
MGPVRWWWQIPVAILLGYAIWRVGSSMVRSISTPPRGSEDEPDEPEDVEGLDVFLVCRECGTELKVSRLGKLQIPRHCGEPMQVVRRPSAGAES